MDVSEDHGFELSEQVGKVITKIRRTVKNDVQKNY